MQQKLRGYVGQLISDCCIETLLRLYKYFMHQHPRSSPEQVINQLNGMCIQVLQNRSVNPISIRRGRLCPPHPYSPQIFRPSTSSGPEQMINYLNESATRFYKTKDQSLLSIPQIDSKARTPFFLKNLQKVNKCIFSSFCVTKQLCNIP